MLLAINDHLLTKAFYLNPSSSRGVNDDLFTYIFKSAEVTGYLLLVVVVDFIIFLVTIIKLFKISIIIVCY
jgi:hypothetical protein